MHCGNTGNYMQLYLVIQGERISRMTYLCSCEPSANVAVEALCGLAERKTLDEAASISREDLLLTIGSQDEELGLKSDGLIALLRQAIREFGHEGEDAAARDAGLGSDQISWDKTLSS